jgi:deazaflavin-dependent oxidoreductase (nitroreductase family)
LGGRLLLLESIGARTGLPRLTVLEVVEHDAATDTFYAAAGFGPNSDWYRNVLHRPEVQITVGRRRCRVYASPVEAGRAGEILIDYARRYPRMARAFMRFMGFEVDGSDDDYRQVVRSLGLHLIAFTPRMAETNSWTSNNH